MSDSIQDTGFLLVDAVRKAALRIMGPYGPCYCREPQPSAELGHEHRCQQLVQALKAHEAALKRNATP